MSVTDGILTKISEFRERQQEIIDLNAAFETAKDRIRKEYETEKAELDRKYDLKLQEAQSELKSKVNAYNFDMKDVFGICDTDRTNLLDLFAAVARIQNK
jgi:hypothetical protein